MAIVLWTLAGSGPEQEPKSETPKEGMATEEESGQKETEAESSEERNDANETQSLDLEDKVCYHCNSQEYQTTNFNKNPKFHVVKY